MTSNSYSPQHPATDGESHALIGFHLHHHVAVVTMNNPPANTWTAQSLEQLKTLVQSLNLNKEVYALVLTGAGEKFFWPGRTSNCLPMATKRVRSKWRACLVKRLKRCRNFAAFRLRR